MGGPSVEKFIQHWQGSGGSELANSQAFLIDLCDLLELPRPEPARPEVAANAYTFECQVTFHNGGGSTSTGRVDLYRRGCLVLESKQGALREEAQNPLAKLIAGKSKPRKGAAVRHTLGWDEVMLRAKGQAQAVRQALESLAGPADTATVAKLFTRAPRVRVQELLETLAGLGQARVLEKGRYAVG